MKRAAALPTLDPPEDPHITTLFVGGLDETITEADIKNNFYQYGEIRQVKEKTIFYFFSDTLQPSLPPFLGEHGEQAGLLLRPVHKAQRSRDGRRQNVQQAGHQGEEANDPLGTQPRQTRRRRTLRRCRWARRASARLARGSSSPTRRAAEQLFQPWRWPEQRRDDAPDASPAWDGCGCWVAPRSGPPSDPLSFARPVKDGRNASAVEVKNILY